MRYVQGHDYGAVTYHDLLLFRVHDKNELGADQTLREAELLTNPDQRLQLSFATHVRQRRRGHCEL
jgi:hypothetical protein